MNESRDNILSAAFELFIANSYREVSIQDIVDKVGMTKGAFYYFFKSKEELFHEIFRKYFISMIKIDFSKFSQETLSGFYHDYLNCIAERSQIPNRSGNPNVNVYAFIFDALKHFPPLQIEVRDIQIEEQKAWEKIIGTARQNKEIKTAMSDEEIASIFIYISDGCGMRSIMDDYPLGLKYRVLKLWDAFYNEIKA